MIERYKGNNNVSFIALPHIEGLDNIDFKKFKEKDVFNELNEDKQKIYGIIIKIIYRILGDIENV